VYTFSTPSLKNLGPTMPRKRPRPLWPVALPIATAALVLGIRRAEIYEAVELDRLPAYRKGTRVRVLTEDLVKLVRSWPRYYGRKPHA
jgi:excisionase family DNA binding protein